MNIQQLRAEDPLPEVIDRNLPECVVEPVIWVVRQDRTQQPVSRKVEVFRRYDAVQAYQIIQGFQPRPLSHGGPLWGYMYLGFILERCVFNHTMYEEPTEENVRRVMIKKLFRPVVDNDLANGSREDPYKEIMRMKECAGRNHVEGLVRDSYANDHVLGCIDAMANKEFLYIISPYCERESLTSHVPLKPNENASVEAQAREIYRQMLQNIEYIHEAHGICHRDVDPGNFLVRGDHRILLSDLAMSFRIPQNGGGLVNYIGAIGKPPYCPPEALQRNVPFLAKQCDLWACTITLWNLVTGLRLYRFPIPADIVFRYAIMAQGLSPNYVNPLVDRVIGEANPAEFIVLGEVAQAILRLSPPLLEMFQNVLAMRPENRWTREQILGCEWMNMPL